MELNGTSEDALEWDEMDISNKLISINEEFNELDQELKKDDTKLSSASEACTNNSLKQEENSSAHENNLSSPTVTKSPGPQVYQVYSLHNVELSGINHISLMKNASKFPSVPQSDVNIPSNKDSSFSPSKHLPDLTGSNTLAKPQNYMYHNGNISRHSETQNKIMNVVDAETMNNSEASLQNGTDGMQDNSVTNASNSQIENTKKFKQEDEASSSQLKSSDKVNDLNCITQSSPECSKESLQEGKHSVFTFYDYSYLQGSQFKLPMLMKQSSTEKVHKQGSLLHGFYFDKIPFKSEHQPIELKPCASTKELVLPTDLDTLDHKPCEFVEDLKKLSDKTNVKLLSTLSHSSSLDSLSVASDLFGSNIFRSSDGLHRSTSLESWLTPYKSNEDLFSCNGSGDLSGSSDSVGELSKRTLDLLNRLENIQSPLDQKIKRSISDITLQSVSQRMSLTGQLSLDIASSINEDSPASLTELSSSDDLSLCSEDIVLHRNKVPDSNASFRKHLNRSVADESDVNVSMIVNVSCTSACTDDEDDSDLLSSSTLTLTEEELGIKDEDDDSSIATDEDIYEDGNLISGLDYIKNELHTWIRPKFYLTKEKRRCILDDEIQSCKNLRINETIKSKDALSIEKFLNDSIRKLAENNGNGKAMSDGHEPGTNRQIKHDGFQFSKDYLVDDMENGNVANTQESPKEKLNRISAPSTNVSTLDITRSENKHCACEAQMDNSHMDTKEVGPLSNASNSPEEHKKHLQSDSHCTNKSFTELGSDIKDTDTSDTAFVRSLPYSQQNRIRIDNDGSECCAALKSNKASKNSSANGTDSCCNCESDAFDKRNGEDCSVHNFVMEIIDMTSTALKNKSQPECEPAIPHPLAQIKEKVLEHSHRPIQLRKGDFYSYLSLSSHDSDCGEVTKYIEEKSSTPVPLDFADDRDNIECFFEACPEEERVEQETYIANSAPEVPVVKYERLGLIDKPKTSAEYSGFYLLNEELDINVPDSLSQMVSDNFKNSASESLILDMVSKGSDLNSLPNSSKENFPGESLGIAKSEDNPTSSIKATVENIELKSDHLEGKDVLYQDTKTVTHEDDLHLHKERHINAHR